MNEGLEKLLKATREYCPLASADVLRGPETVPQTQKLRNALSKELQIYLGSNTTSNLLDSVGSLKLETDPQSLIKSADPLLSTFLGRKAAKDVNSRILEIFVESTLFPDVGLA